MNNKKVLMHICLMLLSISLYGQQDTLNLDYYNVRSELQKALTGIKQDNYVDFKNVIIGDSLTALSVAEPILFGIYGKRDIIDEKPYKIYHIGNYWILEGTLNYDVGGVFLIIIDERNSQVIKLTHGK